MDLFTIGRFQFGNARAIRAVAENRSALWVGMVLVLLTGIARNYDQNYVLETPLWLVGPLLFSLISGSFLYSILIWGFAKRRTTADRQKQWTAFIALFWVTAPIAWLYAIPVERIFDPYHAAQANLALLGIVSLWRVLLMSRILAVLLEIPFPRAFGWVLVAASLEVILVVFLGAIFNPVFSRRILAGMAGMRNAPEERLLSSALGTVWGWSWVVLFVCIVSLASRSFRGTTQPLPKPAPGKAPWLSLGVVAIVWVLIAIPVQMEQRRFVTHAALLENLEYSQALAYLSQYPPKSFPPSRRLEPNPYEYRVWDRLPPTVSLLSSNTPTWIRDVYLSHFGVTLSHYHTRYGSLTNVAPMLLAIEKLPEGRAWLLTNQVALARDWRNLNDYSSDSERAREEAARTNLVSVLRRIGIAETNLPPTIE